MGIVYTLVCEEVAEMLEVGKGRNIEENAAEIMRVLMYRWRGKAVRLLNDSSDDERLADLEAEGYVQITRDMW